MILKCPGCHKETEIIDAEILKQLDPKYPSQRVTVNCTCGEAQFILEAKRGPSGDRKVSVRN